MTRFFIVLAALALSLGCTVSPHAETLSEAKTSRVSILNKPYLPWSISHLAPDYMEAYLVGVVVFDVQGKMVPNARAGIASMRTPSYEYARPGWPDNPGVGSANDVHSDLPKSIIVNWRSRVENQEYFATIDITDDARQHMMQKHMVLCPKASMERESFRNNLVVGLAPGGIVKLWVNGTCLKALEIGRYEARKVSRQGSDPNLDGHASNLGGETREYLRHHPIPFGSW